MGNLDHLPLADALGLALGSELARMAGGGSDGMRRLLQRCLEYVQNPLQPVLPVKLGECLRRLRELRCVTMGQVARTLNVSVTMVSDWELDRAPMSDNDQRRYLDAVFASTLSDTHHEARELELLEKNTALVFELREVDRQRMVREFHTVVVGSTLPDYPGIPPEPILRRQARLITEEYLETMEAIYGQGNIYGGIVTNLDLIREPLHAIIDTAPLRVNFPALLDGSLDLDYVVEGLRCWCGIDSRAAWKVLQVSNMAKAGGPRRASDGKMLKPPGWKPPDFAAEIERQRAEALARQRGPK